jgi:bacillithiol biosynthesis cysteine-adding enzyme BshC
MKMLQMPLRQTRQFSGLFLDYLDQHPTLQAFYSLPPTLQSLGSAASACLDKFTPHARKTLVETLSKQYEGLADFPQQQIDKLARPNTLTIATGHQLNLLSGPVYVMYKLVSTIRLAQELSLHFPDYQFVPLYWMATEDHDLAEINHFELFGKKYEWQTAQKGAVGRMKTEGIQTLLNTLPEKVPLFEKAYQQPTLAEATRYWVHALFGKEGLLVLNADTPAFKQALIPCIKADVLRQQYHPLFEASTGQLEQLGYERQVNGREINFFYLEDGLRERIVKTETGFEVLNTSYHWSQEQMEVLIEEKPEDFSPNVVMRPVYQQTILPNLAYVGGPAELAYWLQLRSTVEKSGTFFPVLIPRNFVLYLNQASLKRMEKLELTPADLFLEENELKQVYLQRHTENTLDLDREQQLAEELFEELVKKALRTDASLEGLVKAEKQKLVGSLENIGKRLRKAEEQKQATQLNQLSALKAKLFPGGGLQERNDNFLNFYLNRPQFLNDLLTHFNPLDFSFNLLMEDE